MHMRGVMDSLGRRADFSESTSKRGYWGDVPLRVRIVEYLVLIVVPILIPNFSMWLFRYNQMGVFNLSIGDCGATVCAVMIALLARNWGKPKESHGWLVAFLSGMFLMIEMTVLVACDSTAQVTRLLAAVKSSEQDGNIQIAQSLATEVTQHSPGVLYWILSYTSLAIVAIYEGWIILGGQENA